MLSLIILKVYCEADRKEVLDYLDINIGSVPNKTLVIGTTRPSYIMITDNEYSFYLHYT